MFYEFAFGVGEGSVSFVATIAFCIESLLSLSQSEHGFISAVFKPRQSPSYIGSKFNAHHLVSFGSILGYGCGIVDLLS